MRITPFIVALYKCDEELRKVVYELFEQLNGNLEKEAALATAALISDIISPNLKK